MNASVPPAPTTASTAAPVPAPPAGPTLTVKVFVVAAIISVAMPATGSLDLG